MKVNRYIKYFMPSLLMKFNDINNNNINNNYGGTYLQFLAPLNIINKYIYIQCSPRRNNI